MRTDGSTYPLTIYYESDCAFCNAGITDLMYRDTKGLLRFRDVSDPAFESDLPGISKEDMLIRAYARCADGRIVNSVEVFRLAYCAVGMRWFETSTRLPILRSLAERAYAIVARNRHRLPKAIKAALSRYVVLKASRHAAAMRCGPKSDCRI